MVDLGYTVVRLDYDGAGDSDGGDWEEERLARWLDSIDAAVGVLRSHEGIRDLNLVGIRMGATLACLYADAHPGVSGLVLWAPCANGASYVREMRILSRLSAAARPRQRVVADWFPPDSLEVAGFEVTRSTADSLAAIDLLTSLHRAPAARVLIVERTEVEAEAALADRLTILGSQVEQVQVPGYGEFITTDETTSILPTDALERISTWFATLASGPEDASAAPPIVISSRLLVAEPAAGRLVPEAECASVIERIVRLPAELFGIISEPADPTWTRRVAVLILNTGATNRVGSGRLSVAEARYWAGLGFTVLRVDLGHTGESAGTDGPDVLAVRPPERIREVAILVDWLRSEADVDRVVVCGTCSGAYQAFHAVVQGAPIDLAVLVNPAMWYVDAHTEAGMEIYVARTSRQALLRGEEWVQLVRRPRATIESARKATRGFVYLAGGRTRSLLGKFGIHRRDPVALPVDLRRIAQRGVKLLVVFAAAELGEQYLRTFAGEAVEELERTGMLTVTHIDGGDHVFSPPGARQQLVEAITLHLEQAYPRRTDHVADREGQTLT